MITPCDNTDVHKSHPTDFLSVGFCEGGLSMFEPLVENHEVRGATYADNGLATHIMIPDTQAIHIGDHADMPSMS